MEQVLAMRAVLSKPALTALALALILSACASRPSGQGAEARPAPLRTVQGLSERLLGSLPGQDIDEVARLTRRGADMVLMRVPARQAVVTLIETGPAAGAGQEAAVRRWRGIDNAQIWTRGGMITGTRGFGDDLMTVDTGSAAALIATGTQGQITRIQRRLDGEDRIEARAWVCDILPRGSEEIRIREGASARLDRVDEECHGPAGRFTNTYWLSGQEIVQTRQFITAGVGMVELLFLD